jgi:hypothetical protein
VPGASCAPEERVFFAPFVWANTPLPNSATKTPTRQKRAAITIRRLKKADFEVDFFFIGEAKFFLCGEPEMVIDTLGEMQEACQQLFEILF